MIVKWDGVVIYKADTSSAQIIHEHNCFTPFFYSYADSTSSSPVKVVLLQSSKRNKLPLCALYLLANLTLYKSYQTRRPTG